MLKLRKSTERGHANHGWLDTYHTFSFADYHDPENMGFRTLRVINEDRVAAGQGFPTHAHRDMEILTYVLTGKLEHKDSMGTGSIILPGDVQRMSAGTGVTHSEYNASKQEPLHLLQIWILPERKSVAPGYEQKTFPEKDRRDQKRLVASGDGRDGSVSMHQKVDLYASLLSAGKSITHTFAAGRHGWLQLAGGNVECLGERLAAGDGAAVSDETQITVTAREDAHLLLFDLS